NSPKERRSAARLAPPSVGKLTDAGKLTLVGDAISGCTWLVISRGLPAGIAWRCSDSMSLRDFLRLENREKVSDHSWLSKTRGRLPHEIHAKGFGWGLQLVG